MRGELWATMGDVVGSCRTSWDTVRPPAFCLGLYGEGLEQNTEEK